VLKVVSRPSGSAVRTRTFTHHLAAVGVGCTRPLAAKGGALRARHVQKLPRRGQRRFIPVAQRDSEGITPRAVEPPELSYVRGTIHSTRVQRNELGTRVMDGSRVFL